VRASAGLLLRVARLDLTALKRSLPRAAGFARGVRKAMLGPLHDARLRALAKARARPPRRPLDDGRPLHIGFLCSAWDQQHYGITVWTRVLAAALVRLGHRVVVFRRARSEQAELVGGDGVRIVTVTDDPLRSWPALPPIWPWLAHWQRAVTAAVLARDGADPFDVVSGPIWPAEPLAMMRAAAVPLAVSLHTTEAIAASLDGRGSPKDRALVEAERALFTGAPLLIANSEATLRDLSEALGVGTPADRAVVVPHGMPDRAAAPGERRAAAEPLVLFLGQLGFRKGIDVFLDALPSVLAERGATVAIAGAPQGESPEAAFRARHAGAPWADRVRFLGLVDDVTKQSLLAAAAVVAVPSRYESFGLVSVEAMMHGVPVVASRAGGIPEVVEDGVTGLLVPPGDAPSLAAAICRILDDACLRQAMGKAGRARYLAHFTDTRMATAWLAALRSAWARMTSTRQ
jgi:glycogen(starch) synthase